MKVSEETATVSSETKADPLSLTGIGVEPWVPDPTEYSCQRIIDAPDGYPMLARYISSTDQQYIFREYRYLQTRVLLYLQDELRVLETQLFELDEKDRIERPGRLRSREEDDKTVGVRGPLMEQIRQKLKIYADFLVLSKNLASMGPCSEFTKGSLKNFFNAHNPLKHSEKYVMTEEDLVILGPPRDEAWLDQCIHRFLVNHSCALFMFLFSDPSGRADSSGRTVLYSHQRIYTFKMIILITIMLGLLIGPLYPLYTWCQGKVENDDLAKVMGLQCGCTLALGILLSIATKARKHEIFTTCAGYMAVLVVFMSQASTPLPN